MARAVPGGSLAVADRGAGVGGAADGHRPPDHERAQQRRARGTDGRPRAAAAVSEARAGTREEDGGVCSLL